MSGASIFDLSPSEKLQLVEDLWDDLAASPESVPVYDWQKQEQRYPTLIILAGLPLGKGTLIAIFGCYRAKAVLEGPPSACQTVEDPRQLKLIADRHRVESGVCAAHALSS